MKQRIESMIWKTEKISNQGNNNNKRLKNDEDGLKELWDSMKHNNIHIIWIPEGEECEQGMENLF